jgi:hypothetical protein
MALTIGLVFLAALVGMGAYLRRFRPRVTPLTAAEIDRQTRPTGLADDFWVGVSRGKGLVSYPDSGATYWLTQLRLPPGATLEFQGSFPHARHLSFNTYDPAGRPVDRLSDIMIVPDGGAQNPYIPGAPRDVTERGYRIRLAEADLKAGEPMAERDAARPVNTLYAPANGKPVQLWMRVYVPDTGLDARGGVPLPQPVLILADGTRLEGKALCDRIVLREGAVIMASMAAGPNRTLLHLKSRTSAYHPAQPVPQWVYFFNPPYALVPHLIGTRFQFLNGLLSTKRKGGFYSTLDNTYIATLVDRRHGEVLVIRGKAPTTPRTRSGEALMQEGQLRYWSFCKYRSLHDPDVDSGIFDEEAPLNSEGWFTIVVSRPEDWPTNATVANGVAWMDWGTVGDSLGNPDGGMLVYRHMIPSADFTQSLFAIRKPQDMHQVLGDYLPAARYMSREEFERLPDPTRA